MEMSIFWESKSPVSSSPAKNTPLPPLSSLSLSTLYNDSRVHHSGVEASLLFQVGTEASSLFQPGAE